MSDESNFQKKLLEELALLFDPIVRAAQNPELADQLVRRLGWSPEALFGAGTNSFQSSLPAVGQAVGAITQAAASPPQDIDDLVNSLNTVGTAIQRVGDARTAVASGRPPAVSAALGQLAGDTVELLALTYLARRAPIAVDVLRLLTVVHDEQRPEVLDGQNILRPAMQVQRLDLARILDLLQDPIGELKSHYLPNGLQTDADVLLAAQRLYPQVGWLAHAAGATVTIGRGSSLPELPAQIEAAIDRSMTVEWRFEETVPELAFGTTARLVPASDQGPGAVLSPFGETELDFRAGAWLFTATLSAAVDAILITQDGIEVAPASGGGPPLRVDTSIRADRLTSADAAMRIGSATGTRLEVSAFGAEIGGGFADGEVDVGVAAEMGTAALVIAPADGDGFIAKILPPEGFRADFALGVAWSRKRGLRFSGGATIDLTLPIHAALGPLSIDAIHIAAAPSATGLPIELSATATAELGPLSAAAERVGLSAMLTFPPEGGNAGPANITLAFKPPTGVGLAIDAGPVTGGGYLYFDPQREQYSGVAELSFKAFSFKAVGLLTTRLPDGSRGFSLLLIVTAEFPPLQLGFGFTLNGLGGLLGINRTANVDALRTGLKRGGLDSIMFPPDPVLNAPQILSDLQAFFPAAPSRFVFGPMAALGWGTPQILRLELGVVLELPAPLRLILMGKLICALPAEDAAIVYLRMDVLGILDFDRSEASVDATLVDSFVAIWTISGDMAMRANFGARPNFALAAGGFNPRYVPPPEFPQLARLAIALAAGDNPRLRLESYLALTSNTAQVGARIELYVAADLGIIGLFSLEGHLGFDALFQFVPFYMRIDISGGIALKRNGRNLFAVGVDATIEGPTPWHVFGEASFDFLWATRRFPFDLTFGEPAPPAAIDPVNPLDELKAALEQPGNWSAALPPDASSVVTFRQLAADELLAHPMGAALTVRQRVLPLGVTLETFGNAPLAGLKRFEIDAVRLAGAVMRDGGSVRDHFAPAQFFKLTADQRLARPSFEEFDNGRRLEAIAGDFTAGPVVDTNFDYETVIIDEVRRPQPGTHRLAVGLVQRLAELGAAGRAAVRERGAAGYAGPALDIDAHDTRYMAVRAEDLRPVGGPASLFEALDTAAGLAASPGEAERLGELIVIGDHEVSA